VSLEAAYPNLITKDSPSQRVGNSLNNNFETVPHLVPMLSLENSYNAEDLNDFDRKAKEGAQLEQITYCVEPKFDGASISLVYENDILVRACTRGDGVAGEEITQNIKQIRSIPLSIPLSSYGIQQMEIRGEVIMSKKSFEEFNQKLIAKQLAPLANPRNAAAGSLRMKDPKEVAERNLDAFIYHISFYTLQSGAVTPDLLKTHSGSLELLWNMGFRSPQKEKKLILLEPVDENMTNARILSKSKTSPMRLNLSDNPIEGISKGDRFEVVQIELFNRLFYMLDLNKPLSRRLG
jgi:DNA ligase (NAD+)